MSRDGTAEAETHWGEGGRVPPRPARRHLCCHCWSSELRCACVSGKHHTREYALLHGKHGNCKYASMSPPTHTNLSCRLPPRGSESMMARRMGGTGLCVGPPAPRSVATCGRRGDWRIFFSDRNGIILYSKAQYKPILQGSP